MSHFVFLQAEWPQIAAAAQKAEAEALGDPRTACFYARRALELLVAWLYEHDGTLRKPYQHHLSALIFEPTFQRLLEPRLMAKAKVLKDLGNLAVHGTKPVRTEDAVAAVRDLFHLGFWLAWTYARQERPSADLVFRTSELPLPAAHAAAKSLAQVQQLSDDLAQKDEALAVANRERAGLDEEIQKLREEVARIKAQNQILPDTHDYSEAETRAFFIDLLLKEAGWPLDQDRDREFKVQGMPNSKGEGFVDYVLWGDDGKPLGLVEAKRTTVDPKMGRQQAKLYADCLQARFGQRPVIFLSNGYEHWVWDDTAYPPRSVQGFYRKDELELLIQRRSTRKALATADIDPAIVERAYQHRAIRRIGETFEKEHHRKALVVMATGAGKTRTVIALCDLLMRCNWVKRVLFLADRVALVNQAVGAFKKHLPAANPVNLVTEKNQDGRVFVSTYPTMMGLIDEMEGGQRRFGPGQFDLIIIDEAHRSVYQKYRAIFGYFDSLLVGLTATPKDEIDKNTYSLFDLETGVPTDIYGLDEAVKDGYLVPPTGLSVPLRFPREGITYDQLTEDEKEQWDDLEWEEEAPEKVDAAAVNQWLFNADTVDKALEVLMAQGLKVASGDRLGKTIIFAKSHDHAEFIAERFDKAYPHYKGHFARVIDFKVAYAQSLIDDFSKAHQAPHIAISVDMLDTGIDVPEVVNLVFFKPVRSRTKFWQMVGRGTRLCKDLFGPGQDKKTFLIFDLCQNLEFFNQHLDALEAKTAAPLGKRLFTARTELILALDRFLGSRAGETSAPEWSLRHATADQLRAQVAGMSLDNFLVRPHRKLVEAFGKAEAWENLSSVDAPDLVDALGDLPSSASDPDEDAKRFDLLALRIQLAILRHDGAFTAFKEQMQAVAAALSEMGNIPRIKAEMPLILDLMSETWWEGATALMIETVRLKLRSLVGLIERVQRKVLYTHFEDQLGDVQVIEIDGVSTGTDPEKFKAKVRQFLLEHENHLAILRLRTNQPLTATDLGELERMLAEAGLGDPSQLAKAKETAQGLGLFIRSLVGLDREAAKAAFAGFLAGRPLNASQLEFINLIIDYLTEHGTMDPALLYESPFTDLNSRGVDGLFQRAEVEVLIRILDEIQNHAVA